MCCRCQSCTTQCSQQIQSHRWSPPFFRRSAWWTVITGGFAESRAAFCAENASVRSFLVETMSVVEIVHVLVAGFHSPPRLLMLSLIRKVFPATVREESCSVNRRAFFVMIECSQEIVVYPLSRRQRVQLFTRIKNQKFVLGFHASLDFCFLILDSWPLYSCLLSP